jgi:hypothetical protein
MRYRSHCRKVATIKNKYRYDVPYNKWKLSKSVAILAQKLPEGYIHAVKIRNLKKKIRKLIIVDPFYFINIRRIILSNKIAEKGDACFYSNGVIEFYPRVNYINDNWVLPYDVVAHNELCANQIIKQRGNAYAIPWDEEIMQKFYLDHVLIHEIGHSLMIFSYRVAEEKAVEQFAISYLKDKERHRAYMNMVQRDLCSIDEKRFLIYRWLEDCAGLYKEKKDQQLSEAYSRKLRQLKVIYKD